MSDCCFLRSSFSLRKGFEIWKHWKYGQTSLFFTICHKLCQTAAFWGRYLASRKEKNMKVMVKGLIYPWVRSKWPILRPLSRFKKTFKQWKNSKYGSRTHFLSFSKAHYGHLAVFLKKKKTFLALWRCKDRRSLMANPWTVDREPYKRRKIVDRKLENHRS